MNNPTPSRIQIRRPGTPPVQDRRRLAILAGVWLVTLIVAGPWLVQTFMEYILQLYGSIPQLIG